MPSSPLANAFAAAAQPPSIDSELTRIRAMVDRAQFLEALSDLAQLVARDPRNSKVWLHIGFVYVRMSIWPQAMEALQMALEIEPRMPNAQRLLALALFSTGRRQEACDLIDDACRHAKNENTHWMTRAYIHSHTSSDPLKSLEVARSEEHTSELQSQSNLVCRLLLEKKK